MEVKKSESANLENMKGSWVLMGLVAVLSLLYVSFEWAANEHKPIGDIINGGDIVIDEELIPITMPEKKTVPPPPQAVTNAELIEIVDNNTDIEETTLISQEDNSLHMDIDDSTPVIVAEPEEEEAPLPVAEVQPEFPGGYNALAQYLRKNIKYPTVCQEQGIQGRVIVAFVVNKDGSIVDAEVIKPINPYLDKEALRVVNAMPRWKPGMMQGKPVRVRFSLPVQFKLSN